MANFDISDEQRKGTLIGSLLAGAARGFMGGGVGAGIQGAAQAYTGGINSIFEQKKAELDAQRTQELIDAGQAAQQLAQRTQAWNENPQNPDNAYKTGQLNALMAKPTLITVKDGESLYDPTSMKRVFTGPPDIGKLLKYGDPTNSNYQDYMAALPGLTSDNMTPSDVQSASSLFSPVIGSEMTQGWQKPITDIQAKQTAAADKVPTDFSSFFEAKSSELRQAHPEWSTAQVKGAVNQAWHDQKVGEQVKVGVTVAQAKAKAYSDEKKYQVKDNTTGNYVWERGYNLNNDTSQRYTLMGGDVQLAQDKAEARQRGGSQSATVNAANDLYQENLPKLIALRNKVAARGLLPDSKFKSINAINQWAQMETSDPDVAELQGKVKLMADNLQKTLGGAQGGEWAFKVADTLLNPALQGPAFERRMTSHGNDLAGLAKSRRNFGKNPVSTPGGNVVKWVLGPDGKPQRAK